MSLIGLFVFLAVIVFPGADDARNSAFGILIGLGMLGLITTFISWIIAMFIKQAGKLKKQLLLFPVLYIALIVFGASSTNLPQQNQSVSAIATAVPTLEEYKASSINPDPRSLARTADTDFKGKKVHLTGTIVQVIGKKGDQLRVNLKEELKPGTFKEPIAVYIFRKITIPAVQSDYIMLVENKKKMIRL